MALFNTLSPAMPGLKRPLQKDGDKKSTSSKKPKSESRLPPAPSSLIRQEVDFPRGGGSTLTPLEHQQVLREVKAEASAAKSARVERTEDLFIDGDAKKKVERQKLNRDRKNAEKKKSTSKAGSSSAARVAKNDEERPDRVEVLNYKRLATGTRMLCSVLAVHPLAIVLSLPDQLLGHVPITNISDIFTSRLEGAAEASEDEDESEEESDGGAVSTTQKAIKNVPELRELFAVGAWVVASVVSIHTSAANNTERGREGGEYEHESRKVELTLEPSLVNEGILPSDLSPGFLLPMTLKGREDHGYLVDTGIQGLSGFISFKDFDNRALHLGQVVYGSVLKVAENGKSVSATLKHAKVASSQLTVAPTIAGLMPGNLVKALVTASTSAGLNVKLFGLFDGTVTSFHLNPEQEYKVGQHVKARILWDIGAIGAEAGGSDERHINQRKFALSTAEHIVKMDVSGVSHKESHPIGTIVQAVILSTTEDWGLTCSIESTSSKGFTHISACSDSHVASLPSDTGPFRVKTKHQARVVGHSPTDNILQLSFQQSVLSKSFMRVSEVMIGEVIKCTIKSISLKSIILDINGAVDGVVFPLHFADIPLKKPEKKYKVGQSVRARVLKVDPDRNRIVLTLKKTLVQSDLAVVWSLQDARVGVVTHGTVGRILEGNAGPMAVLVDLFGHLRTYVPISEVLEAGSSSDSVRNSFFLGKCVKLRLTRVDYQTGKISASIKQASESYLKRLNVDAVQVGEIVKGRLAAVHQDVVVLELKPSNVRALIGLNALARERKTTVEELRVELTEGEMLENLKVLDKNAEKGIVILGGSASRLKTNDVDVKAGSILTAKVRGRDKNTIALHIGQNVRGRLHVCDCTDDYGSGEAKAASILPAEGSEVTVYCLNVRGTASKKADVSMRPSRLREGEEVTIRDDEIDELSQLQVGSKVRGFVKAMAEKGGLFVELGRNIVARIMIAELFDSYIKDWTGKFAIGQLVEGTITDVQPHQNKVEMSLRTEPGKPNKVKAVKESKAATSQSDINDLTVGDKVDAFVKNIAEYGLFLQIEDSTLSGLAHKSMISDDSGSADVLKAFTVGDRVKAKIMKVDKEKRKISFGLKPSLFDEEDFEEEDDEVQMEQDGDASEEEEEESGSEVADSDVEMDTSALLDEVDSDADNLLEVDSGSGEDDDSEGEESDEEESVDEEGSDELQSEDEDESEEEEQSVEIKKLAPALELAGGFSWSAGIDGGDSDSSSSSDESSDDERREVKKKSKSKKAAKKYQEDLTADLATKTPDSMQDFERLLLGSPNSSFLWIQYMSFQLQLGDVIKGREVARRALQVINFREEQEKFNIWIAMINLENTFGTDESLEEVYKEACSYNDDKKINLRFAEILERSEKMEKADEQWKRTTKKFGFSSKVWVEYHRFLLRTGRHDDARAMIPRSMQSLPKRKHVKTITACALNDFRIGDAERGRTIFEGLVDTYPKRLDIWWQYVDQETRSKNMPHVRDLFDRILSMKQSSKKVKSVLKKWLEVEKKNGDQAGERAVLERAKRFVEERAAMKEGEGDESGEEEEAD
jgi:rRNA biogenesis protein RRP5